MPNDAKRKTMVRLDFGLDESQLMDWKIFEISQFRAMIMSINIIRKAINYEYLVLIG